MGFLDSMLGEMVRRETGFNATRMIRKIGSKRLLMMGGAALAGGLLAQKASTTGTGSFMAGASGGAVPGKSNANLPPVPGSQPAAVAPQLPPVPVPLPAAPGELPPLPDDSAEDSAAEAEQHSPELLYAIVRTMVAAALSDGALEAQEKAAIDQHLADSGLTDSQQSQIRRDLVIPAAPGELAGMLPDGEDPEVLLQFAILVLRADGELEEKEMAWLESFAELLGVEAERRTALVQELAGDLFPS